jgi:alpha-methylacyl-CoA racemase
MYPAREGWIAVAALEPHFRAALTRELGADANDGLALARAFTQRSAVEWKQWAEARDLPLHAVR